MNILLATAMLIIISACQKPHIELRETDTISECFTDNVNFERTNYIASDLTLPLEVARDKGLNGTISGSLISVNDRIVFQTLNGFVHSVKKKDLKDNENFRPTRGISTNGSFANGNLYIAAEWDKVGLISYDLTSREILWEKSKKFSVSSPVIWQNKIYHAQKDGRITCFNAPTGKEIWEIALDGSILNNLAFNETLLFAATLKGTVAAIVPESGSVAWKINLEEPVRATPILVGKKLAIVTLNGNIFLVSTGSGKIESLGNTGSPIYTTPSFDGRQIYVCGTDGKVHTFNVADRKPVWARQLNGAITVPALVLRDKLVVGSDRKLLYILNKNDGTILQELELKGRMSALPLPHEGGLLMGMEYRKLIYLSNNNED